MNRNDYDELLEIVIENAKSILDNNPSLVLPDDEDKFHDMLFGEVLTEVDNTRLSYLEAREISEVCGTVESDIVHGDILGL